MPSIGKRAKHATTNHHREAQSDVLLHACQIRTFGDKCYTNSLGVRLRRADERYLELVARISHPCHRLASERSMQPPTVTTNDNSNEGVLQVLHTQALMAGDEYYFNSLGVRLSSGDERYEELVPRSTHSCYRLASERSMQPHTVTRHLSAAHTAI